VKADVTHLTTAYDKVNTHCGGGGPPAAVNPALHKRCAKPFRELSIRWDGNVAVCCNDFRGIYKIGNVRDYPDLDALWQHERFAAARQMLYHESRDFMPCVWCDAVSPRVGLLPDKHGKQQMARPDENTLRILDEAVEGDPYTPPVLRGWELGEGGACLPPLLELGVLQRQALDE
jgi:radical SAM protein with 4Fe4S-binding SPASM domain